jgi:hypothetical protein
MARDLMIMLSSFAPSRGLGGAPCADREMRMRGSREERKRKKTGGVFFPLAALVLHSRA